MNYKTKDNIIFLHLPKNGGMTFNRLIDRLYPKENVYHIKVKNNKTLTTQDFIDLPEIERSNIHVLKGHMYYGLHEHLTGESKYITFLRHPEQRVLSFYNFVKTRPTHRLYDRINENNMSFHDFVENIEASDVNNAQVRLISGLKDADDKTMLTTALDNIDKHFSFVGLQENYDESLLLLKKLYGWSMPYYNYRNKTDASKQTKTIDNKTRALILKKNAADIELFNHIQSKLMKQIEAEKNMPFQLSKLSYSNKIAKSIWGRRFLKVFKI
jgi:hypothetical protein